MSRKGTCSLTNRNWFALTSTARWNPTGDGLRLKELLHWAALCILAVPLRMYSSRPWNHCSLAGVHLPVSTCEPSQIFTLGHHETSEVWAYAAVHNWYQSHLCLTASGTLTVINSHHATDQVDFLRGHSVVDPIVASRGPEALGNIRKGRVGFFAYQYRGVLSQDTHCQTPDQSAVQHCRAQFRSGETGPHAIFVRAVVVIRELVARRANT